MNKPWMVKEIGRLGLGYISKVTNIYADRNGKTRLETKLCGIEDGLEIYMWAEDFSCRWVIASFELYEKEHCFELREVGDRMCNPDIDWVALGELVVLGHDMLMSVEENLD